MSDQTMPAIPIDADPAVRFILATLTGPRATLNLEADADLGHDTVRSWRYRSHSLGPRINTLRKALAAIVDAAAPYGYELVIQPRTKPCSGPF